jgi:hypothetical protein
MALLSMDWRSRLVDPTGLLDGRAEALLEARHALVQWLYALLTYGGARTNVTLLSICDIICISSYALKQLFNGTKGTGVDILRRCFTALQAGQGDFELL